MSFWDLSDGEQVNGEKEYEAPSGGGNLILPEGSSVMASIDECKWHSFQGGEEFISIRWNILAPEDYQGRKIFQKIYPDGDRARNTDPEKAKKKGDNARRMLAAIDANCGGGMMKLQRKPTDEDFAMHLTNKPMVIRLGLWDMQGNQGNWVQAVSPASKPVSVDKSKVMAAAQTTTAASSAKSRVDLDDDIPF